MAQEKMEYIGRFADVEDKRLYNDEFPPYQLRNFGTQQVDFQERINMERMRKERLAKAREEMRKAGVSVMFLLGPANMRYAVAYTMLVYAAGNAYVLLPLEGDPIVFGHTISAVQDRRHMPWIKPENMRHYLPATVGSMRPGEPAFEKALGDRFGQQIKSALEEMKLDKEVLTFDMYDGRGLAALERVGIKTAVNGDIMMRAQEIKTKDEIECFRVMASIVDIVHYELSRYAEPGKTELDLAGYMNYRAMAYGCEPTPGCFSASGPNSHPNWRYSSDRRLRPGDIFFADVIQASWNGYKSCCYRTYSVATPPSQAAKDTMKRALDYYFAALSECKPGKTTGDMMKQWPELMYYGNVMHGLGQINYGPPWGFAPGYSGISKFSSVEYPYPIKEGQVFAIEIEMGIGDGQGVRIEDDVVVTKDGYEMLTQAPREIITVPVR